MDTMDPKLLDIFAYLKRPCAFAPALNIMPVVTTPIMRSQHANDRSCEIWIEQWQMLTGDMRTANTFMGLTVSSCHGLVRSWGPSWMI